MLHYAAKKIAIMLLALFVIASITFFLMKAVPGDPFTQEKAVPKEILDALYKHYKLNDPWYVQYGNYLKSIVTWDLGPSFKYQSRTVNEIINDSFPISAILGAEALLIAIISGIFLGSLAALKRSQWQDHTAMLGAVFAISVPSFILAAFLQYLLSLKLGWFPVARWGTFQQSVLPAISLAALPTAFIARLTRANMLEVLQQDYLKTAKAKGLSRRAVVLKHCLRNAFLPILSYLGPLTANVLTGSFIIEKIFGIPGLGQWFVTSISNRDYTVIMGMTVFYGALLLFAVFLVDMAYPFIDPRMKLRVRRGS